MLPRTSYHLRSEDNDLTSKVRGLSEIGRVMAFLKFTKEGKSQKLLHELKYRNKADLARELGKLYGKMLLESGYKNVWDQLVPVPLHPLKQQRRGYNQSEQFANGLSGVLEIPVVIALARTKFTETQTNKSRLQRLDNVEEVFSLGLFKSVNQKSIMLVDDVMTTGATLCACANVLLASGAKNVDLVTIAAGG